MINTFLDPVMERMQEVETRMLMQSNGHHPELAAALGRLLKSGGKRIRVALALLTGSALGADPDRLISLAAAIELLHTATLVHDDLIDGSLMRRGFPTINARWSPAATVLTGDFIFARAAKLAAETESVPVIKLFSETLAVIVNGEISQMFNKLGMINSEEYEERIYAKTASLFETASTSAAILSGAKPELVERARRFGISVGMAFQIVDDILDFTGDQATVGKPVASDLRQGIITLPVILYAENHSNNANLTDLLNGENHEELIIELVHDIRQSNVITIAMNRASEFILCGLEALSGFPESQEKASLQDLASFITSRQK